MRAGALAFLCGILLFQGFAELPAPAWLLLGLPVAGAVPWVGGRWRLPLLALAGLFWAMLHAHLSMAHDLAPALEGRDLTLEGRIVSLPEARERATRFVFAVETVAEGDAALDGPRRVRLAWYEAAPPLQVGERWRLRVRLKRPNGFSNPGGFDYEAWLLRQRIRATGYVRPDPGNRQLAAPGWASLNDRARAGLARRLAAPLEGHPMHGVVAALLIGERGGIAAEQWAVLNRTGTSHLVAISGLHIGLVAGLVFFAVRGLWSRSARLLARLPAQRAAAPAAAAAAVVYAALAGFSVPTQRALIMVGLVMAALFWLREARPSHTLALALAAVLAWDPFAVLAPGFWLSFGAVAAILFGMGARLGAGGVLARWGRVQWIAALGLSPLLVLFFQQASLVAPLANLLAVPVVSLLIVPAVLAGAVLLLIAPGLGEALLFAAAEGLRLLWIPLAGLADTRFAVWTGAASAGALAAAALGALLWVAPRGLPGRWLGAILCLPLFVPRPVQPAPGTAWFTLLDVGQGLAAVVRTANHTLVYDTGPAFSAEFDTGAAVLVPFLRGQGVRTVDTLVISHADNDHRGGAASLLAVYPAPWVYSAEPAKLARVASRPCRAGEGWTWEGVSFAFLHPPAGGAGGAAENDLSCVLRVQAGAHVLLLPGDIERAAEWRLLGTGAPLRADVLVAPHHGSKTSSTPEFVAAVSPRYVLFPVGYRNRWAFPRPEIVQRWRGAGAVVLDTAAAGAISLELGGASLGEARRHRIEARRYWHRN